LIAEKAVAADRAGQTMFRRVQEIMAAGGFGAFDLA